MARRRIFFGKDQAWCEAELAKAQADAAAGVTSIGGTAGDTSHTEQQAMTPLDRIDALLLELHFLDPVTYPRLVARGTRVTKGIFRSEC